MAVLPTVDSHIAVLVSEGREGQSNRKEAVVPAVELVVGVLVVASKELAPG